MSRDEDNVAGPPCGCGEMQDRECVYLNGTRFATLSGSRERTFKCRILLDERLFVHRM